MENQHRHIPGYRDLTREEVELIAMFKEQGNKVGLALNEIEKLEGVDKRALSIARTNFQTGQMWLIRAVARPEGF
ncbi:MAG TPA: hypothetical protein VEY92_06465 [Pseudoxanthomonas sp.]|nr:hypothetical protein [Pseudoxanthomonas sp.]